MTDVRQTRRRRLLALGVVAALALAALAVTNFGRIASLFDRQPEQIFGSTASDPRVAVVLLSGDMGLRLGIGGKLAGALAGRGIPVLGVSSPVLFAQHRSRAEVDTIVAHAIRSAVAKTRARQIVLMGQSFGADIVAVAAPDLPPALRQKLAAIMLIVPGRTAYFRVDPSEFLYRGTPDALPLDGMRKLDWISTTCIYGVRERDSLCPGLSGTTAKVIGLPGGHFLERNDALLIRTLIAALGPVVQGMPRST